MTSEAPQTTDLLSHTPGPWDIQSSRTTVTVRSAGSGEVISSWYAGHPTGTVTHANARLIAAAPELLASLKEMGDWIAAGLQASDEAWPDERCLQHTEEIAARARAAVDKAEGRS